MEVRVLSNNSDERSNRYRMWIDFFSSKGNIRHGSATSGPRSHFKRVVSRYSKEIEVLYSFFNSVEKVKRNTHTSSRPTRALRSLTIALQYPHKDNNDKFNLKIES
ncbi:hypothetical protein PIB30_040991 [Stylosanthes scabra]|uniref:Uncharacterized protein n=1 Tax=Stylosanthes scabra TaxID=79078 RepID=A0ABU6WF65_9FABA|nr:hypothetical protein [Stylosanthes scabra]